MGTTFLIVMGNDAITMQDNATRQMERFMAKDKRKPGKNELRFSAILPTDEQLPLRAG